MVRNTETDLALIDRVAPGIHLEVRSKCAADRQVRSLHYDREVADWLP